MYIYIYTHIYTDLPRSFISPPRLSSSSFFISWCTYWENGGDKERGRGYGGERCRRLLKEKVERVLRDNMQRVGGQVRTRGRLLWQGRS